MKKFLPVCLLTIMFAFRVSAGDIPEAVVTLWDSDVFIGEIREIKNGKVTVEVSHALFENYDVGEIILDEFEYMTFDEDNKIPNEGDYLAVAAEYKKGGWVIAFSDENCGLIAKSNGLDPETLILNSGGHAFVERMNIYINDGAYSYKNRKEIYERINGEAADFKEPASVGEQEEADGESAEIASEAENVAAPPEITNSESFRDKWNKRPVLKYVTLTFISAACGFVFSKMRVIKKGR